MKKLIVILTLMLSVSLVGCDEDAAINATNGLEAAIEETTKPLLQPTEQPQTEQEPDVVQEDVITSTETEENVDVAISEPIINIGDNESEVQGEIILETEHEVQEPETETVEEEPETAEEETETEVTADSIIARAMEVTPDNYIFMTTVTGATEGMSVGADIKMSVDEKIVYEDMSMNMGFPVAFHSWYDYEKGEGYTDAMGSWTIASIGAYNNIPKTFLKAISNPTLFCTIDAYDSYTIECDLAEISINDSYSQAACHATLCFDKETGYIVSATYELNEEELRAAGVEEYYAECTFSDYNEVSLEIPTDILTSATVAVEE